MSLDHWLFSHLLFSKSLLILNHCQTSIIMRLLQPCHCAVTLQTHHELHSSGCLISKIWWSKCGLYPNSIPGCRPIWGYLCYTLRSTPSVSLLIHLSPSVTTDKKRVKVAVKFYDFGQKQGTPILEWPFTILCKTTARLAKTQFGKMNCPG